MNNRSSNIQDYTIIYNLKEYTLGLYLPTAFVASRNKKGELLYIEKKANAALIEAFGIPLDATNQKLFSVIEKLEIKALENKYNLPKKKRKKLVELMSEDRAVKKSIEVYIHRELDAFLNLIVEKRLTLCWDIEHKVLIKDVEVQIGKGKIQPHLSFKKHPKGVTYNLMLSDKKRRWQVIEKDVVPITNNPAWVFIDYQLYKILHINGFMLRPFQKKQAVEIAPHHVKNYFQSFILKVVSEMEIETEGFEIINDKKIHHCQLELIKNIFNDTFGLKVEFLYGSGVKFDWKNKKKHRSGLKFDKEEVIITRVERDYEEEKEWIEKLENFGVVNEEGSYFQPKNLDKQPSTFNWLAQNEQALEKTGFKVITPSLEGKSLVLAVPKISFDNTEQVNDWFDINGIVEIGEFKISFKKIVPYIKKENRFYPLPNGKFFLIPDEWFTRFRGLLRFAEDKSDGLRLAKSQYTLLEEIGIEVGAALENKQSYFDNYTPSKALKATLRPYQLEGVKWLLGHYQNELGACLADDMGLGKTLQTIAVLLYAKEQKVSGEAPNSKTAAIPQLDLFQKTAYPNDIYQPLKSIIILPASLVFNWEREIRKFAPSLMVYRHVGPKRHRTEKLVGSFDIVLTTYHTALRDIEFLQQIDFEYIVLDESQQIKNKDSKIFKAINQLKGTHKVSLSGTPIENSLADLWSQMQFINPDLLGNFRFFKNNFIQPIEKHQDEETTIQLRNLIQPYLLRRTKKSVAKDLPELTTKIFYSTMTPEQKKLYEKEKSAARNFLLDNFDATDGKYQFMVLSSLTKLRQLANHPYLADKNYEKEAGKFQDVLEHLEVIHRGGHKALLFSSFVQHLDLYKNNFEKNKKGFSRLTGQLSQKERAVQIDQFEQNKAIQSFLISIKAGGTGLNLTAADYVFILDPWWNPSIEKQAIARAHRIGQTKNVIAIKFITKDSIEEKILKLQEKKSKLAEDIIEGKGKMSFSKDEIGFLLS